MEIFNTFVSDYWRRQKVQMAQSDMVGKGIKYRTNW